MRTGSPRNALFKGKHREEYAWFSISDAMPVISIDARRAAARILRACRYGEAEVMLSLPARLAVTFHGIFPGLTSEINAWMNQMLPEPGGIGKRQVRGKESESEWSPSKLTALNEQQAMANNEIR
jgi:hypothetical protein